MSGEREFFQYLEAVDLLVQRMRARRQVQYGDESEEALKIQFESLAIQHDSLAWSYYDHHRFQPDIAIVLAFFRSKGPAFRELARKERGLAARRQLVEGCIAACRLQFKSESTQRDRRRFEQRQKESASSCHKYFESLLRRSPQLFVFRVELYAPIRDFWWKVEDMRIAEAGIDGLLRRLSNGLIVENLLGYVVARESGYCRGLHYSLLAAQNGYVARDAHASAAAVGQEWINRFGGSDHAFRSKANYFSCYEMRQPSLFNEIGYVDAGATASRIALNAAIRGMWDKPVAFDADEIKNNLIKNPGQTLAGIKTRNLRRGKCSGA